METFVLDASALIAFLNDEEGADIAEDVFQKAKMGNCVIYMNKLNILEIYYGGMGGHFPYYCGDEGIKGERCYHRYK